MGKVNYMNTPTNLTILSAVTLFKKSKTTLYKHMKNGTLSKNSDGTIALSELIRCYGEPKIENSVKDKNEFREGRNETELEIRVLMLEKLLLESKKREEIALDRELFQRQQVTELQHSLRLLEDKRERIQPVQRKGFLGRLLG
jgi:hypothetical protein